MPPCSRPLSSPAPLAASGSPSRALVNNAGITGRSFPIWELTDEDRSA